MRRSLTLVVLLLFTVVLTGCFGGGTKTNTVTLSVQGEGSTSPAAGSHKVSTDSVFEVEAEAAEGWEFYGWSGPSVADIVDRWENKTEVVVDGDKELVAFFVQGAELVGFEMTENKFMGSQGTVQDLTNNAPYPPGFEIEILAEPESETDEFLHWEVQLHGTTGMAASSNAFDPRDLFGNYEDPNTTFTIPELPATVIAHFTKRTEPIQKGKFDYEPDTFERRLQGEVGVTEHAWDLSSIEEGTELDFFFHARNLPDRFNVYYGTWDDIINDPKSVELFASGWVSADPSRFEDPSVYPEGIEIHTWHEDVNTWESYSNPNWGHGGKYGGLIVKEAGKDVLMIRVEGRDDGTIWDYMLAETGKFE